MTAEPGFGGATYDQIAEEYDLQWDVHVREPQSRLTSDLMLTRGLRCADLACGTGTDALDMLRAVHPGEVVGVDTSPGMLAMAGERARAAGLALSTRCEEVAEFVASTPPSSFDVVTLRFCLGYLDWRPLLPALPRLLEKGGRVGVLTILATSAPQAYSTYEAMVRDMGLPSVGRSSSDSKLEIETGLRAGGLQIRSTWTHSFRLHFASGALLASFLRKSGIGTHPLLQSLPPSTFAMLWDDFAKRIEQHRTLRGIPLDFDLAAVVGQRPA